MSSGGSSTFSQAQGYTIKEIDLKWQFPSGGGNQLGIVVILSDKISDITPTLNDVAKIMIDTNYFSNNAAKLGIKNLTLDTSKIVDFLTTVMNCGVNNQGMITFGTYGSSNLKSKSIKVDSIPVDQTDDLQSYMTIPSGSKKEYTVKLTFPTSPVTAKLVWTSEPILSSGDTPNLANGIPSGYGLYELTFIRWIWQSSCTKQAINGEPCQTLDSSNNCGYFVVGVNDTPVDGTDQNLTGEDTLTGDTAIWILSSNLILDSNAYKNSTGLCSIKTLTTPGGGGAGQNFFNARSNAIINLSADGAVIASGPNSGEVNIKYGFANSGPYYFNDAFKNSMDQLVNSPVLLTPNTDGNEAGYVLIGPTKSSSNGGGGNNGGGGKQPNTKKLVKLTPATTSPNGGGLTTTEKYLIYGGIAVFVLIILGVIIYFIFSSSKSKKKTHTVKVHKKSNGSGSRKKLAGAVDE